ncbi:MAG: hypothetical protein UT31_C0005G0003 [Parcubacteria group bacterium GW2011_GWF2_39_13b]|nr:MAG: hypothetical protein UT31_C0005G0003 [Parcubacteria group bacterium GW2011_GWF2_39_13b]
MKKILVVVLVAAVMFSTAAMAVDSGLTEYRVVGDTSVSLAEIVDLFIPSLSGGAKFLAPKANGLGLIHQWNPQLRNATWKTRLAPGDTISLPAEWVLRGIQGILEPAVVSLHPRVAMMSSGAEFWAAVGVISFIIGGFFFLPRFGRRLLFRGKEGAPFNW